MGLFWAYLIYQPEHKPDIEGNIRIGTTSLFAVDYKRSSLAVEWNPENKFALVVQSTLWLRPHKVIPHTIDGRNVLVDMYEVTVDFNCIDYTAETVSINVYENNRFIFEGENSGPLSKFMKFGTKESENLIDLFCSNAKPKWKPPLTI